jgi:hypothetical protein
LHDFGEYEVKHGIRIVLVNLYTQELGNSRIPAKLAPLRKDIISDWDATLGRLKQIPWRVAIPILGTIFVIAAVIIPVSRLLTRLTWRRHTFNGPSYSDRSYEKAKWSKIYGVDQLLPTRATFQRIAGWDRNNLAITGTIGNQQLLVLLQNGEWKVNKLEGPGAIPVSRFASRERLVFLRFVRRGALDLVTWENGAYQWLGNVPLRSSLWALAPDAFCGMEDRGVYWTYSGNGVHQFDRTARENLILGDGDVVAQTTTLNGAQGEPMPIASVRDVTRVGDGKAIGLWSVPQGKCAVVCYHDGRWYLVNEVAGFSWNNVPNKAWFLDEKNFVAIGSDKVARCVNGKVEFQALSIGGQEYPAKELAAVWGHDPKNYWVADPHGNVFGFDKAQWKLIAHGPELKQTKKFEAFWPAPNGSLIAVTANEVFVFE